MQQNRSVIITAAIIASVFIFGIGLIIGVTANSIARLRAPAVKATATPLPTSTPRPTATPTPTPIILTREAIIRQVQPLSRLETTSYVIERVIEAKQSDSFWPDWLRGDRLLLVAHGTVIAGVDLSKLRPEDVIVDNEKKTIQITLPAPEILTSSLSNERTRVYDRQRGIIAPTNKDLESTARLAAEKEILQAALDDGILTRAGADAQRAMEQFLGNLGYTVTVKVAPAKTIAG